MKVDELITVIKILVALLVVVLGIASTVLYYTLPCDQLAHNWLTGHGNAPMRCVK